MYNASAGSGKTFTLVKRYLHILLSAESESLYRQVLAITFTNKAAEEMKERVLGNLLGFAQAPCPSEQQGMLEALTQETGMSADQIRVRSAQILQGILQNYSAFNIKTIDSFTNRLIKSFAHDLGMSLDFEVELDTDAILNETVDAIIARIGLDEELTELLVAFAREKTLEDRSWDISRELMEMARLLLNENHALELKKLSGKRFSDFKRLIKDLKREIKSIEEHLATLGDNGLALIGEKGLTPKDFYYGRLPKLFDQLINDLSRINFEPGSSLAKNLEEGLYYSASKPDRVKGAIDAIISELISLYQQAGQQFERYRRYELILANLVPLAVVNTINEVLEEIKENNNIRLHAEFNSIISRHLREQPAAFIYEKIGERFRHYFIDEMQDTSVLQWENLIPLLENALSGEDSSLLLVGDAKQAIYRWRGGRAEQFIELATDGSSSSSNPFPIPKSLRNLETNYRSYSEIVDFNNRFFSYLAAHLQKDSYRELYLSGNDQNKTNKEGGYVEIQFLEQPVNAEARDTLFAESVYQTLLRVTEQYAPGEICILVRKRAQGTAIANFLTEKGMDIVSSETLQISNNPKVNFLINLLQFGKEENNGDARFDILYFLHGHLGIEKPMHEFHTDFLHLGAADFFMALQEFGITYDPSTSPESSLFEAVEEMVRAFRLAEKTDAFVQFFLDFVFDFTQRRSLRNKDFLDHWEEKKEKLHIVNSEDLGAVRIMTIHKAKGLEFPVVIFPYDLDIYFERSPKAWYHDLSDPIFKGFESILVNSGKAIRQTGEHGMNIYEEQLLERELDGFNLLYVCLTRAVEQLYVLGEDKPAGSELKHSSQFLKDFLSRTGVWEAEGKTYSFGTEMRSSKKEDQDGTTEKQEEFISSSWKEHRIHIAANSSALWDSEREEAIAYGNLIHEILADVISHEDLKPAVEKRVVAGMMTEKEGKEIENLLRSIVEHEELRNHFEPGLAVRNEREMLSAARQIVIPDRLVFRGREVTVLDYKTGSPDIRHQDQIDHYASVLAEMQFEVKEKILVYVDRKITVIKSE